MSRPLSRPAELPPGQPGQNYVGGGGLKKKRTIKKKPTKAKKPTRKPAKKPAARRAKKPTARAAKKQSGDATTARR
jgi:hypothetical protein